MSYPVTFYTNSYCPLVFDDQSGGMGQIFPIQSPFGDFTQYSLLINGYKIKFWNPFQRTWQETLWYDSSYLRIKNLKNALVKVSGNNCQGSFSGYIDTEQKQSGFLPLYSFKPKMMTETEAVQKVEDYMRNISFFSNYPPVHGFYNRYGICLIEENQTKLHVYWAFPKENFSYIAGFTTSLPFEMNLRGVAISVNPDKRSAVFNKKETKYFLYNPKTSEPVDCTTYQNIQWNFS